MSDSLTKLRTSPKILIDAEDAGRGPQGKWLIPGQALSPESLAGYYNRNALDNQDSFEANDWLEPEQMYAQFQFLIDTVDLNGKTLLDVGAGNGIFYEFLASKNIHPKKITAIDIAEEQIAVIQKRFPNVTAIADDFFRFEFEESFDVITMFGVSPCLKFIFPTKDRISSLLRLLDRALHYANEGIAMSFLNHNAYERSEEEHYEYVYYYPEEVCALLSGAKYTLSTATDDLVANVYLHAFDASDNAFRFNLNRIDSVLKLLR